MQYKAKNARDPTGKAPRRNRSRGVRSAFDGDRRNIAIVIAASRRESQPRNLGAVLDVFRIVQNSKRQSERFTGGTYPILILRASPTGNIKAFTPDLRAFTMIVFPVVGNGSDRLRRKDSRASLC
jgi:hypothetical protein